MRESTIEQYLVEQVKALGGECRKLRWIGRNGAPDRIVMLNGQVIFIELKAPGGRATASQLECLSLIRDARGFAVCVDGLDPALRCLETWGLLKGAAA